MNNFCCQYIMTSHVRALGSRAEVWHGNAKHTSGGLEKKHLMMNKRGRIVSRKKHATAKKQKRLEKAGFKAKKGTFKLFKKSDGKTRRKRKGGGNEREEIAINKGMHGGDKPRQKIGGVGGILRN